MMEDNAVKKGGLVSAPQKSELPVGVHLFLAVIFLLGAIAYTISPIDIIPDVLGPIGWVDDIMVWVVAIMVDLSIIVKRSVKKGKEHLAGSKQKDSFI
jgi:uncharacterized membrane protein YkvA (DUF1232 family)